MKYPLAYLITFSTYGSWLHGDERGSVDKKHNEYRSPFVPDNAALRGKERCALKNAPLILDHSDQQIVLQAILRVCETRGWFAHAVHVRSNHVHIVVTGEAKPEKMMVDFKAYATRAIKSSAVEQTIKQRYWTQHGSTRYLWTKESLATAVKYVRNGQGNTMTFGATKTDQSPERK